MSGIDNFFKSLLVGKIDQLALSCNQFFFSKNRQNLHLIEIKSCALVLFNGKFFNGESEQKVKNNKRNNKFENVSKETSFLAL